MTSIHHVALAFAWLRKPAASANVKSLQPIRRAAQSILCAVAACALLAACASSDAPQRSVADHRYGDEPFPVRVVDRSRFEERHRPAEVANTTGEGPGTVVIDTQQKQLFLVIDRDRAFRYGVAVGAAGKSWKGTAVVGRKAKWPRWYPTDEMRQGAPGLPATIASGPDNPLGARALYLYQNGRDTLYRIHGTTEPWSIGTEVSSGCIRMTNEDVIALYEKIPTGTRVVVR